MTPETRTRLRILLRRLGVDANEGDAASSLAWINSLKNGAATAVVPLRVPAERALVNLLTIDGTLEIGRRNTRGDLDR